MLGGGERWGEQREGLTALNVGEGKGRDGGWGLLLQIGYHSCDRERTLGGEQ